MNQMLVRDIAYIVKPSGLIVPPSLKAGIASTGTGSSLLVLFKIENELYEVLTLWYEQQGTCAIRATDFCRMSCPMTVEVPSTQTLGSVLQLLRSKFLFMTLDRSTVKLYA